MPQGSRRETTSDGRARLQECRRKQYSSWALALARQTKRAATWAALFNFAHVSKHLRAIHLDAVTLDLTGDCHMVSFMSLQRFRIAHRQHLLILVGDNDHLGAGIETFLGAFRSAFVGAFNAALGIATQPLTVAASPANEAVANSETNANAATANRNLRMPSSLKLSDVEFLTPKVIRTLSQTWSPPHLQQGRSYSSFFARPTGGFAGASGAT